LAGFRRSSRGLDAAEIRPTGEFSVALISG